MGSAVRGEGVHYPHPCRGLGRFFTRFVALNWIRSALTQQKTTILLAFHLLLGTMLLVPLVTVFAGKRAAIRDLYKVLDIRFLKD